MDLPAELIINILSNLRVTDLLSCCATNKFLQELINTSALLQYHVACHKYGVEDNPKCTLDLAMRLEELHSREKAWSSLKFSQSSLDMKPTCSEVPVGFGFSIYRGILPLPVNNNPEYRATTITFAICSPEHIQLSSLDLSWISLGEDCEILDSVISSEEQDLLAIVAR
jgi:hypothetical protein